MAIDNSKNLEEASFIRFCKVILGWDYFSLLEEVHQRQKRSKNVDDDRGGGDECVKNSNIRLRKVKSAYKSVDDYLSTFEPLLFEEVKAHITQGKDEEEVNEWTMRLVMEWSEVDGFLLTAITYGDEEGEKISQNDLLLLSKEKFSGDSKNLPRTYAFALVEHHQRSLLRLRMYVAGEIMNPEMECANSNQRLLTMRALITSPLDPQNKRLYCLKICSLSTISREYLALRSVGSLPFKDMILHGANKISTNSDVKWKISSPLADYLSDNLNKSQLDAIDAGLSRNPFVLIQGPPGTGKTQTILALISAILHATPTRGSSQRESREMKSDRKALIHEKYEHWARASPWICGQNRRDLIMPVHGDDGFYPTSGNELKPEVVTSSRKYRVRVLVCAPSNSALDEIVLRILTNGIRDENGRPYTPKIVRIGLKAHHSVKSVSMDYLVKQKQGESASSKFNNGAGGDSNSIRSSILDESAIVFSTLSFSGSALLGKMSTFDVVIIDEAAQAVEPATLVPLASGCKQVFLVGDPLQLPATVISPISGNYGYGTSMFERFQKAGFAVNMLKTQYRMHPQIRKFPSAEFYRGALEDAEDLDAKTSRDWHKYRCFAPFVFFDIHEGAEVQPSGEGSYANYDEVEFVLLAYHKLISLYPHLRTSSHVAIISPYRFQVKRFQERFNETYGAEWKSLVDIQTVDGFQGREKDVAIFSCVRASKDKGIGFLADARRMNVGITRAKSTVLVVGSAGTLRRDHHWRNFVEDAEARGTVLTVSKPYNAFFSDHNMAAMLPPEDADMADGIEPDDAGDAVVHGLPEDDDAAADEDEFAMDEPDS